MSTVFTVACVPKGVSNSAHPHTLSVHLVVVTSHHICTAIIDISPIIMIHDFPFAQISLYQIYIALRQIGPVLRIPGTCALTFDMARTAKTEQLKQLRQINCDGHEIMVYKWPLISEHESPLEQPEGPAHDDLPADNLDALNDDCLRQILKCKALSLADYCSLSQASRRLNGLVKDAFRRRYKGHTFVLQPDKMSFRQWEALLRHFGEYITSIEIVDTSLVFAFEDIMLGMIGYYCRDLRELKCRRLLAIGQVIGLFARRKPVAAGGEEARRPFGQLKRLDYTGESHSRVTMPHMALPSLRDLRLNQFELSIELADANFFAANKQIERLALCSVNAHCHIEEILEHLPSLAELQLKCCNWHNKGDDDTNFRCFGRLQRLTALTCTNLIGFPIIRAMCAARIQLERLTLRTNSFPECFWDMLNLRHLDIGCWQADALPGLLAFVQANRSLAKLRITSPNITFDYVRAMLAIVPGQLKVIGFCVNWDELRSNFITYNRDLIDGIDRVVKRGAIDVHVSINVWWEQQKTAADAALLDRCSDWLHTTSH